MRWRWRLPRDSECQSWCSKRASKSRKAIASIPVIPGCWTKATRTLALESTPSPETSSARLIPSSLASLNRWVRQGQKLCTVKREGRSIDLLSPVEGVLVSVNHHVLKDPNLVVEDPYKGGWLCVIKAPELAMNTKNLLQDNVVAAWMQNSIARLGAKLQELTPALAQDGGLPIKGLFFQVDAGVQQQLAKEFFLT